MRIKSDNVQSSMKRTALSNLEQVARRLRLKEDMFNRLAEPQEKIEVVIHPEFNTEPHSKTVRAFVVRHNDVLGPAKGGIRMMSDVTLDDIVGLAMEMTWKTSLIGVPFGGGKSGICYDPTNISSDHKEIIIRSFTRGIMRHIGPEIYIPAPDLGTNEEDMGHIRDCISYSKGTSITNGCFVTGKPVILGGIVGRREATGRGVVYSVLSACKQLEINIKDAHVIIQGFGNVGSVAALAIAGVGAKVIAVSDINGGIMNSHGLNIHKVLRHAREKGFLTSFKDADGISNRKLFEIDCDILIPAATQCQITAENADKVKTKIIAEGANSPTTPEADKILEQKKVFIIPDILCNAGGVFVSYLEYTQETQRNQITEEEVDDRLKQRMTQKFNEVYRYASNKKLTMRDAAMEIAVSRVVDGINARGLLP